MWNWAKNAGHVARPLPLKGLRYPKMREKPPFQTLAEIERRIAQSMLSTEQENELWSTLFLAAGALTWFTNAVCNIFCHLGDDPEYRVVDSRILAILTWGEGWHGHHHKNPADPDPGQGRYDPAYFIIKLVQKKHK